MGYPAAYRSSLAQDLNRGSRGSGSGFQQPPSPANDNVRQPPKPANDNNPQRSPSKQTLARSLQWSRAAHGLERLLRLTELNPSAHVAHDIFNLWRGRFSQNLPQSYLSPGLYGMPAGHGWFIEGGPCNAAGAIGGWVGRNDPYQCVVTLTLTNAGYASTVNNPVRSSLGVYRVQGVANVRAAGASNMQMELVVKWRTVSGLAAGLYPPSVFTQYTKPGIVIEPVPIPYPQLDPMQLPVGQPVTQPRPLPRPARIVPPNPFRAPSEQPQRGPSPATRPGLAPGQGTVVTVRPGAKPTTRTVTRLRPQRPPKGTKEVKLRTGVAGLIAKLVNAATESKDFIDAVYKGLPKKIRGKAYWEGVDRTPQAKARLIYENFDQMNWGDALYNLLANQLEDRAFGKLGRIGAKANKARSDFSLATGGGPNIGIGLQTGPAQ